MDFTVGIVSQNLATTSNFVEFRDSLNFTFFEASSSGAVKRLVRDMWCDKIHLLDVPM